MPNTVVRLGTRGSQLARWQAQTVADRLAQAGGPRAELVVVRTTGDRLSEAPLSEIGGKRIFVKELEDALIWREIDLAVHSSKDMSAVLPDGLTVAAVLPREDPRDALVLPHGSPAGDWSDVVRRLGVRPRIGTGSVRRIAQLRRALPGATFSEIRGNLDTRLRKLDEGSHDALVLAAAGLRRLDFASRISAAVPANVCVPAPGQGIVAVEIRADDQDLAAALARIDDEQAHRELDAERALVAALGGGCQMPLGGFATTNGDELMLDAIVLSADGGRSIRQVLTGPAIDARALGERMAAALLAEGAGALLQESTK
ncbi:MAG TPA: hydroxymethylbilane synthase [Vicinamibacterales bacterium]